jgi:hypothetical protein
VWACRSKLNTTINWAMDPHLRLLAITHNNQPKAGDDNGGYYGEETGPSGR